MAGSLPKQDECPGARPARPAVSVEPCLVLKMGFCLQGRDSEERSRWEGAGRKREKTDPRKEGRSLSQKEASVKKEDS